MKYLEDSSTEDTLLDIFTIPDCSCGMPPDLKCHELQEKTQKRLPEVLPGNHLYSLVLGYQVVSIPPVPTGYPVGPGLSNAAAGSQWQTYQKQRRKNLLGCWGSQMWIIKLHQSFYFLIWMNPTQLHPMVKVQHTRLRTSPNNLGKKDYFKQIWETFCRKGGVYSRQMKKSSLWPLK